MKVNLEVLLLDAKGKEFNDKGKLGDVLYMACINNTPTDAQAPLEQKLKVHRLAKKIGGEDREVDLTAEEISLLKERVSLLFPIVVVGAVVDVFESGTIAAVPKKDPAEAKKA